MATLTVYADANDGYAWSGFDEWAGTTYVNARAGNAVSIDSASGMLVTGQRSYFDGEVNVGDVGESFLDFDTSGLGSAATVSAAVFSLYQTGGDDGGRDITAYAKAYSWSSVAWVNGANLSGYATRASYNFVDAAGGAYRDFTSDSSMAAYVSKTERTKFLLCDSDNVNNVDPVIYGYLQLYFSSANATGTTQDPKLTVTYTTGSGGGSTALANLLRPRYLSEGVMRLG